MRKTYTIGEEAMPAVKDHIDGLLSQLCELLGADGDDITITKLTFTELNVDTEQRLEVEYDDGK